MSRNKWYRQCKLSRPLDSGKGEFITTTWVPDDKGRLRVGAQVRLRNRGSDPWSPWWTVLKVGDKKPGEYVEKCETDYRRTREASDV